jgi:hypothetical protein
MVITMNYNPSFKITLHDYTSAQQAIKKTPLYQVIEFKINNNRMEAYNKNRYLGYILKKDTTDFKYIWEHPEDFQALIVKKELASSSSIKLHIDVQVKKTSTYHLFKSNKENLNKLISLKTIFKENEEVYCNYGPATIIKVNENDNTVEVDIPGLGRKKIYDIYGLEKK